MTDRRLDIGRLYVRHREELLTLFVRRTSDTEIALDLWSETFAEALARSNAIAGAPRRRPERGCMGSHGDCSLITTAVVAPSAER
jgi:DNA-directed RNA polymerase specialized sigma24 family protein